MEPIQQEEVLIARNNETGQVGAVAGLNEDGTPKMADVKSAKLSDLVKFSKGQNPLEAFMSNFIRQCQNPTVFGFFRVPADRYDSVGVAMAGLVQDPVANAEMLKNNKVEFPTPENAQAEKVEPTPSQEGEKPQRTSNVVDESKIDWDELKTKWGIDRAMFTDKELKNMQYGHRSKLITINADLFGEKVNPDVKISFYNRPDGTVGVKPHFCYTYPDLSKEFMGVKFSDEDQDMLKKTGNLGRVVELTDAKGNKIPSYVSIDRDTNEIISCPTSAIWIKDKIGAAELTQQDKAILRSGQQLVKDYPNGSGKTHKAVFQLNAVDQSVEFVPRQCQLEKSWTLDNGGIKPIGRWKNVEFTDQQKADYVAGKTVKVDGYIDPKGKEATVYVKFNPELGRPTSYRNNPDLAASVKPAAESETQMAVNKEGRTNEATKNVSDPLQKGQTAPKDDAQQRQQRKPRSPRI